MQLSPVLAGLLFAAAPGVAVSGDAGCIDGAALLARVQQWSESSSLPDDAIISVDHTAARLHVRIARADGRAMERAFAPPPANCNDAELVAVVAVSLALDATSTPLTPPPTQPPALVPASPEQDDEPPPALSPPPKPPATVEPRKSTFSLGLGLGGSVGVVPTPAFESALAFRVHWPRFSVFVAGETSGRARAPLANGTVDIARFAAAAGVCVAVGVERLGIGLCGAAAAGAIWARSRGIARPASATSPWLSVFPRAELSLALDRRWSLVLVSDANIGIVRPSIVATQQSVGTRVELPTPRVGWRGLLEVRVRWGTPRPARSRP